MATATKTRDLHPAEIKKLEAETEKALAEGRQAAAEAAQAEATAEMLALELNDARKAAAYRDASDIENHVYRFFGPVNAVSSTNLQSQLAAWHRMDPACKVEIVFNSPGGSVIDGMALFDYIEAFRREGHHVTTVARGYAASMAGILLQAGDHRVIGHESYLMIHEISAGAGGKIGEIVDAVKFYEKICDRVVNIFVRRAGGKITRAKFIAGWKRIDWWLDSQEALKLGFVDEIRGGPDSPDVSLAK